nr:MULTISPECIES: hypothetical protein [unclassified Roseobacter]
MRSKGPDIFRLDASRRRFRKPVIFGIVTDFPGIQREELIDLRSGKPVQVQVEPQISFRQSLQFFGQETLVPGYIQSNLIVCQYIGPFLNLTHMLDVKTGHQRPAQELSRRHAPVTGQDRLLAVNQYRVGKAKCLDTGGNLFQLRFGVLARVLPPRVQAPDIAGNDPLLL